MHSAYETSEMKMATLDQQIKSRSQRDGKIRKLSVEEENSFFLFNYISSGKNTLHGFTQATSERTWQFTEQIHTNLSVDGTVCFDSTLRLLSLGILCNIRIPRRLNTRRMRNSLNRQCDVGGRNCD